MSADYTRKLVIITTVLLVVGLVVRGDPGATWADGGWILEDTYTNPYPTVGTPVATLSGTVTYTVDNNPVGQQTTETVELLAGEVVVDKKWVSTASLQNEYAISDVTGGTAIFDAEGRLNYEISAPNDGEPHAIKFKLTSTNTNWFAKLPLIRNFALPRVIIQEV